MLGALRYRSVFIGILAGSVAIGAQCAPEKPKPSRVPVPTRGPSVVRDVFRVPNAVADQLAAGAFKLQAGPKPPQRVGQTLTMVFPPPAKPKVGPPKVTAPPLSVVRTQPTGKVGLQSSVTVSFNQPMVPLASLADLAKLPKPLQVEPAIAGQYRWLGTSTLSLEAKARIPFSTTYTASVPQGTRSAAGKVLEKPVTWTFETPRLGLVQYLPSGYRVVPKSPIVLVFNQRVDPQKLFAAIRFEGPGAPPLKLVERSGWKKLGPLGVAALRAEKGRVVVLQPTQPLMKGSAYRVRIKAGVVAGEGPLPTKGDVVARFSTYPRLVVEHLRCGYGRRPCRPSTYKYLRLSNRVRSAEPAKLITISPKVENYQVDCRYRSCRLLGKFKAQTQYTVTVSPQLEDIYEQKLGYKWTGSFRVVDAYPQLRMPVRSVLGLSESKGNRQLVVRSINVRSVEASFVKVYPRLIPHALRAAEKRYWRKYRKYSMVSEIPGVKVGRRLTFNRVRNKWQPTALPVDVGVGTNKPGVLFVELKAPELRQRSRYARIYKRMLVQVTDLGLTVRYDVDRMLVLVTGLTSGLPRSGVTLTVYDDKGKRLSGGKTDARGLAELAGPRKLGRTGPVFVVATKGDDVAFLRLRGRGQEGYATGYSRYASLPKPKRVRAHLYTERTPYRPGETVRLTGVLRLEDNSVGGGISALPGEGLRLKYFIRDARRQLLVRGKELMVDADGVFRLDYKIPEGAALGSWWFYGDVLGTGEVDGKRVSLSFSVLHYRTPEYKVKVTAKGEPFFFGDTLRGEVQGRYYYGTAMAGAPVKWTLRRALGSFRPPNHEGFRFGELRDWTWRWRRNYGLRGGRYGSYYTSGHQKGEIIDSGDDRLDDRGRFAVKRKLAFFKKPEQGPAPGPGTVGAYTLEAEVFDKNRQSIAGRKVMTVHPAAYYAGLRMKEKLVRAKQDATVQVVVADLDGKRLTGRRVKVVATQQVARRQARKLHGAWTFTYKVTEKVVGGCNVVSAADVRGCKIRLPKAGYYRVRAETTDKKGRKTRSVIGVYAVGKRYVPWKQDNSNRLELVTDRSTYRPGDTARILIKSPFRAAVGLLTVERNGIRDYRVVQLDGSVHVERVKIGAKDLPNLHVTVALVRGRVAVPGAAAARDLGRPRFAVGRKQLKVRLVEKRLQVKVSVDRAQARPGARSRIQVKVTDHRGRPVRSRVAVMLVDEGVLSLLGFRVPDPTDIFHNAKPALAALQDGRADLLRQQKRFTPVRRIRRRPRDLRRNRPRWYKFGGGYLYRRRIVRKAVMQRLVLAGASTGASVTMESKASKGGRAEAADTDGAPPPPVSPGPVAASTSPGVGGGGLAFNSRGKAFATRALFASTAYFNGKVATDAAGRAEVSVKLPENLTTFRITAVALDRAEKDRFGRGEGRVTVRRPLMLMPALPRFANFGDRFAAAVKVTNGSGKAGEVRVKLEVKNAKLTGPAVQAITLKPGQTEELRFAVAIGVPGRARFRFLAYMGKETDAVVKTLAVNLPATTEATATYGVTSDSVAQPLLPPSDALRGFGGLEMSFSSTALTGMQDAVKYLINYPYECTEQTASRVIPIFALREILPAFRLLGRRNTEGDKYLVRVPLRFLKAGFGKSRSEIERQYLEYLARSGVTRLLNQQRYDGGFGLWARSHRSSPYVTAYATYALLRAREAGFGVASRPLDNAARYLSNYLNYRGYWRRYKPYYAWTMRTMAAWLLSELRTLDDLSRYNKRRMNLTKWLPRLFAKRAKLPLFAKALLLVAFHRVEGATSTSRAELLREINNAAVQDTPYKVHFNEKATESLRLLMHSTSRTDAIVLAALMEVDPKHSLVPKVVRGLIEARVRGRWETTQSNAYALLALSRYYKHYEKVVPDYRLRAWLGNGFLGQTTFRGRTMRVVEQKVPMSFVMDQGKKPLILEKQGAGKLYYRLGLRYAPKSLRVAAAEQGFSVQRDYEPVEEASTVVKKPDGTYRIQAGKYVRVRLRIVVPSRRYFVAVDDPLPAGLEAVDLNLRTAASSRLAGRAKSKIYDFHSYYSFFAFSHREKRDDRVVLFADRLPSGVYEVTYLARATTLGRFVTPPAKAHEMYHPEVFGRTGSRIVEVVTKKKPAAAPAPPPARLTP